MRKVVFLLVATATLLTCVVVAEAIEPYLEFREELNLSEQQMSDLESILSSLRKDEIRREADLQIAEVELDEFLRAEKVDLSKVKSKLEEIGKLQANLKFLHIKAKEDGKKVLTEEQLNKFRKLEGLQWEKRERLARIEEDVKARVGEMEERYREIEKRHRESMSRALRDMEAKMRGMEKRYRGMMERLKKRE